MNRTPRGFFCAAALLLSVVALNLPLRAADEAGKGQKKLVIFIAGKPSHGFAQHEHNAGCEFLSRTLHAAMPDITTKVYHNGWPTDSHALDGADAIIMYCDGGSGHMVVPHLKEMDELANKGVGIGCIHYAVEVEDSKGGPELLKWIGGYFQAFRSINPHWQAEFKELPKHAVTRGVHPFSTNDEWYYHMRFRDGMKNVTAILSAVPPPGLHGTNPAHDGSAEIHEANRHEPETTLWVSEDPEHKQRGFGCTGGHFHFNWSQPDFRKTVLNSIAWVAHVEVPENGIESPVPTAEDLLKNLDPKDPKKAKAPADLVAEAQKAIDTNNAPRK